MAGTTFPDKSGNNRFGVVLGDNDQGDVTSFRKMVPITGHASNPLPDGPTRGIECTADGNLVCVFRGEPGVERTIAMTAGQIRPYNVTHVRATSTGTFLAGY